MKVVLRKSEERLFTYPYLMFNNGYGVNLVVLSWMVISIITIVLGIKDNVPYSNSTMILLKISLYLLIFMCLERIIKILIGKIK